MSISVLAPLGVFLTYQANRDSGVFNADIYKNAFRWLFGLRSKRHLAMKEVIIDDPDYTAIQEQLTALTAACKEYNRTQLRGFFPHYIRIFSAESNRDSALLSLNTLLNSIVEQLANSRRHEILRALNSYPVLSVGTHAAPLPRKWMNMTVGIVLPLGVFFYARACFFRYRLKGDLKLIVKTNKEIQDIIYEKRL